MPQVPDYNARQVAVRPVPDARLNVRAGPAFAAATRLGEVSQEAGAGIVIEEQRKADEIALISATRKLKEATNSMLFDPKTGAMTRKGRDAFGLPEEVIPAYDKVAGEIEMELGNDRQKIAFRRVSSSMRGETDLTVQRHVSQERAAYDSEETQSAVITARDSASLNYNDPRRVSVEIGDQVATIQGYAARTGKGDNWARREVENAISKTHLQVIEAAQAHQDDIYASSYYKEIKGQLRGDDAEKAAKSVEDGSIRGESQRIADEMFKGGLLRVNADEEIQKIKDPKLRDAVQQRVDVHFNRVDAMQRETHDFATRYAIDHVERGGSVDTMPQNILKDLTVSDRAQLRAYNKTRSKGESPDTQWDAYYDLVKRATTDPAEFAKVNLMQYRNKLGDTEFKQVVALQAAYSKKDDSFEEKISGYRTSGQIVNDALESVGINPNPKPGQEDAKKVAQFRRTVDEQVILMERNNRRKPTSAEVQEIVDGLLVPGKMTGAGWFGFDVSKRMYEVPDGQDFVVKVDDIPMAYRAAIERQLKAKGMPITPDTMSRTFNAMMRSKIKAGQ
jgi:hypothetical protein